MPLRSYMKKLLTHTSAAIAGFLVLKPWSAAYGQAADLPTITPITNGDEQTIIDAIGNVVNWLFILAGALAVAYLIWGGIQYITGGAKGAEAAKGTIINAIIGIVVIVLAYVIVNAVIGMLS